MTLSKMLGLLLVAIYLLAFKLLALLDIRSVFEHPILLPLLNTAFAGIVPLIIAYTAGKAYLKGGSVSAMCLGCGMLSLGLGAISGGWLIRASDGANLNVTLYNSGAFLGSVFHAIGAILGLIGAGLPNRETRRTWRIAWSYVGIAAFVICFSGLALRGLIPQFFIQGVGPTDLRQGILGSAILLYSASSLLLMIYYIKGNSDFPYWYSLCLVMIAIGLFASFIEKSVGSPMSWLARSSGYLGGLFGLAAVIGSMRDARDQGRPLEQYMATSLVNVENRFGRHVLAVLPIPTFLVLLVLMVSWGPKTVFEPPGLFASLNTLFVTILPICALYFATRSYLYSGLLTTFMLGSGVLALAFGSLLSAWIMGLQNGGPIPSATILNLSFLLAAMFHFAGGASAFAGRHRKQLGANKELNVAVVYLGIILLVMLLAILILKGLFPPFFIKGVGPTALRQFVVGTSALLFGISGFLLVIICLFSGARLLYWYSLALFLITTGLVCYLFSKSVGDPIAWLGRTCTLLAGVYLLVAVTIGARELQQKADSLEDGIVSLFSHRLEGLVEERTAELARAKAELQTANDLLTEANSAISRHNRRLQALMDALPVGVSFSEDVSCEHVTGNSCLFDQFEITPGDNISASAPDPTVPGRLVRFLQSGTEIRDTELPLQRAVAEKRVIPPIELEVQLPSGRCWFAGASAAPILDEQDNVVGGVAVTIDITERKRTEAALMESEVRLRLFIEHAPAAIAMFDTEMRYLAVSRRWLADYRLSAPDILARSHYEIFPEIPVSWKAVHRRGLEGEIVSAEEDRFERIEGGAQWVRWEVRPWHNSSGAIGGIIIFTEDITERKQAEDDLRNSYQRLYAILSNLYGGLLLLSNDGSIEFANPALCEQLQLQMPPSALQGLTDRELIPLIRNVFDEPDRAVDRINEIVRNHKPVKDEEIVMGGGRTYHRDFIPLEIDGKPLGRLWHHRDITASKRIENEIKALNEDLENRVAERTADLAQANRQLLDEREVLKRTTRALKAFSGCRQALIEAQEESVLLDQICRVLVQIGGYRMVWVGYAIDDEAKTIRSVAHAGFEDGYLEAVKITWADEEAGRGPLGTAIRTGKHQINRNSKDNPHYGLWRQEAIKRGYASSIGLPLIVNERVIGVLSLYADDPDAFNVEEVELLTQLAKDISYGITAIRTRLEKKQAQKALDRMHRQQELILKSAWEGIYGIDLEGHYTFMNPAAAHMLACEGEGFIGRRSQAIYRSYMAEGTSSPEGEVDTRAALLAGVQLHIQEGVLRRENGTTFPVELAVTPIAETGKITGGVVTFWDVTERKRAQQEILANIKEIEDLYHNAPCGYHSLDGDGLYVRINDTELFWLGYSKEEVIGKKRFQDILTPESVKIFEETFSLTKERGWVKDLEYDLIRKDGTILPVLLSATALKDSSGNFIMSRSMMFDITQRKRADEELRLSEERFRLIAETVHDVFWMTTLSAKETCYFSPGFKRTWGWSPDELFKSGWDRDALLGTILPEDRSVVQKLQLLSDQGEPFEGEFRIIRSDGEVRWIHDRGLPVHDEDGSVRAMAGIMSDVTDRKQMELELVRSNEDLQQFAYVASHDLQEPLRNVASCLQMLEKKYKDKLDAQATEYIHYAVDGAVRMKSLILDLLEYSRVATKGQPPRRTDCEQVLAGTLKNLRSAISEAGAMITSDLLPTVFVDDSQLFQVFQNLIHNAIKFRRDEPPRVHVSAVKNQNEWVFSVKDNGIGIESRHLERVFVIFQRLHKRSQYEGTGMGLAIVKKIVERHGGRVWAQSEPGVGTTFCFTIPEKGTQT